MSVIVLGILGLSILTIMYYQDKEDTKVIETPLPEGYTIEQNQNCKFVIKVGNKYVNFYSKYYLAPRSFAGEHETYLDAKRDAFYAHKQLKDVTEN